MVTRVDGSWFSGPFNAGEWWYVTGGPAISRTRQKRVALIVGNSELLHWICLVPANSFSSRVTVDMAQNLVAYMPNRMNEQTIQNGTVNSRKNLDNITRPRSSWRRLVCISEIMQYSSTEGENISLALHKVLRQLQGGKLFLTQIVFVSVRFGG
jgi:hypothetical protein